MKLETLTHWLTRRGASALAGCLVAIGAAPGYGGWNPFSPGSPVEVGPKTGQIVLADFNGDEHDDILASHPLNGRASLLLGDGRGEFPTASRATVKFDYNPSALAAGDVTGDNRPDLVVASREGSTSHVHLLLGGSDGRFKEIASSRFAAGPIGETGWKPTLALLDVNGDKKLDVVFANGRQNAVDVFYGSGAGQFTPGQTVVVDDGFGRFSHVVGDLNGDGRVDMAVAAANPSGEAPGRLHVLLGDDQGKLVDASKLASDIPAGAQVKTLCDIDGDKRIDIVLTHGEYTTVLAQRKDGTLAPSAGSPFAMGHEAFGIAAVNAGLEGNDVLVAATVDSLEVMYAEPGGQFRRACGAPLAAGPGAYNVAMGDINSDGKPDIVANSFEGETLSLLLSN